MPTEITLTGRLILTPPENDGSRAIIIDAGGGNVYVIPMTQETVAAVGKDLSAPHVEVATVMPK